MIRALTRHDAVPVCNETWPHVITAGKAEEIDDALEWCVERWGDPGRVYHHQLGKVIVNQGRDWYYLNGQFRFKTEAQVFEFKMRWW